MRPYKNNDVRRRLSRGPQAFLALFLPLRAGFVSSSCSNAETGLTLTEMEPMVTSEPSTPEPISVSGVPGWTSVRSRTHSCRLT